MTRKELIISREYWVGIIHLRLWQINGLVESDSDKWEAMAEQIVDDEFMKRVKELNNKTE